MPPIQLDPTSATVPVATEAAASPPPGATGAPAGAVSMPGEASQLAASALDSPASSAAVAPNLDWVDIRPLDIAGALQILLAEVRASLDLTIEASMAALEPPRAPTAEVRAGLGPPEASMAAMEPIQVPPAVARAFLRTVPAPAAGDLADWSAAVDHAETTLVAALDRALEVVTAWRAVPPAVLEAAMEARTLIVAAVGGDSPNPLWLRPEWLGLVPAMQSFWRRRRWARRGSSDARRLGDSYGSRDPHGSNDPHMSPDLLDPSDPDFEARAWEQIHHEPNSSGN